MAKDNRVGDDDVAEAHLLQVVNVRAADAGGQRAEKNLCAGEEKQNGFYIVNKSAVHSPSYLAGQAFGAARTAACEHRRGRAERRPRS